MDLSTYNNIASFWNLQPESSLSFKDQLFQSLSESNTENIPREDDQDSLVYF